MSIEPATISECIRQSAETHRDAAAILGEGRSGLSYGELESLVNCTAASLRAYGLRPRDSIAVVLPNGPEMAAAFLATASACCCAPLNPNYKSDEYDFYLDDLGARALIVSESENGPVVDVARRRGIPILRLSSQAGDAAGKFTLSLEDAAVLDGAIDPGAMPGADDVALVLHTSGTTSRPKIVPLTQANLVASAGHIASTLQLTPEDRCMNVMPLFHIHGLVGVLLSSMRAGASVVCSTGFVAPKFLEWLAAWQPTWYSAVPTMHQAILTRARDAGEGLPRSLRLIRSSSSALPPSVMLGLEEVFGVPVIESYGMTEASHQMASNPLPPAVRKPGSVGMAAGPRVAVMDAEGTLLAAGETGEVVIQGPNVTAGYANNPEANASAFTNGWFRTGDQGYLDADGYLFLTGRLKELINRGGEKLTPREIDEALLDHPSVAQALAFAMPDSKLGEEVAAAVVLREGAAASEQELRGFAATKLADFKVPRRIVVLPEIPKGPTGKLQRIGLAEKLGLAGGVSESPRDEGYVAPRTPLEEQTAALFAELLNVDRFSATANFFDAGGDSITAAQLIARLASEFGDAPSLVRFGDLATPREIAVWLEGYLAGRQSGQSESTIATMPLEMPKRLVVLQPDGDGAPLVLMHGAGGNVLFYRKLAELLGRERPVFGLQAQGADGKELPSTDLRAMAANYVDELFATGVPARPLFLGGYCLGAYLSIEMARLIEERGGEVLELIAFDTDGEWRTLQGPMDSIGFHWRNLSRRTLSDKVRYLRERMRYRKRRKIVWSNAVRLRQRFLTGQTLSIEEAADVLARANAMANEGYKPTAVRQGLLYVRGTDGPPRDPAAFWATIALGGLRTLEVPGENLTMFASPAVETLAERLRVQLQADERDVHQPNQKNRALAFRPGTQRNHMSSIDG